MVSITNIVAENIRKIFGWKILRSVIIAMWIHIFSDEIFVEEGFMNEQHLPTLSTLYDFCFIGERLSTNGCAIIRF